MHIQTQKRSNKQHKTIPSSNFAGGVNYDINNDKVLVKGSEDGTKRVKFKIDL